MWGAVDLMLHDATCPIPSLEIMVQKETYAMSKNFERNYMFFFRHGHPAIQLRNQSATLNQQI